MRHTLLRNEPILDRRSRQLVAIQQGSYNDASLGWEDECRGRV